MTKVEILSYKENPSFRNLDFEMIKPIPNFKKIEEALNEVPPILIASAILDDVGFTYLLDYYLRYVQKTTVRRILQNPMFYPEALMELFYCQVTAYHKAILQKKSPPELISSYWTYLSKAEYAIIFKHLILQTKDTEATKVILRKIDLVHLKLMTSSGSVPSHKILEFFKRLGPEIQKIAAQDMQMYDFVFNLATNNSDEEYLSYLEEYTTIFDQLRVASFFFEELEREEKIRGKPFSYLEIFEKCAVIPKDTLPIILAVFIEKGWLTETQKETILAYYNKEN